MQLSEIASFVFGVSALSLWTQHNEARVHTNEQDKDRGAVAAKGRKCGDSRSESHHNVLPSRESHTQSRPHLFVSGKVHLKEESPLIFLRAVREAERERGGGGE